MNSYYFLYFKNSGDINNYQTMPLKLFVKQEQPNPTLVD
jgi:hypothetical protein